MCAGFSGVNASAKMPEIAERQHNRQLRIDPPPSRRSIFVGTTDRRCRPNVKGRTVRELYDLNGKGRSIRGIADDLSISRVTVRKYVRSEGVPKPKGRSVGRSLTRTRST